MTDLSPAIERAKIAARALADQRDSLVRTGDWLRTLLEDDEGRPAELLARLGADRTLTQTELEFQTEESLPAPEDLVLFTEARNLSLQLRADPTPTSDIVFLALLFHDTNLAGRIGLDPTIVSQVLRSPDLGATTSTAPDFEFRFTEPTETLTALRAVDANLNRSRESLRVLDDYARFTLNDATISQLLKILRHRLALASERLPRHTLLAARDTPGDVGTRLTAPGEYVRHSPASVAETNLKRLQESLRSLEEFGKVLSEDFAREIEAIRYETYTLEVAIVRRSGLAVRLANAHLYLLVTGSQCIASLDWTIAEAASGGVDVVQLREKNLPDGELLERARKVRKWTRDAGVLFVVNDRADIAFLAEADGVHLGQDDLSVASARKIVGSEALIGVSTHELTQVQNAVRAGADYLGVGPVFPSRTKDFDHFPGLEFVRTAVRETSLPAFALGGISLQNIGEVVAAGANRIAVSSGIATSEDPRSVAQALRSRLR